MCLGGCETRLIYPETLQPVRLYVNKWYSLCADQFTQETANIICKENHDSQAYTYSYVNYQPSDYPIYPYYYQCDGTEHSVCACREFQQTCSSNQIVHIQCKSPGKIIA